MKCVAQTTSTEPLVDRKWHRRLAAAAGALLWIAVAPSVRAGAVYPTRDDHAGLHVQIGAAAQHWLGPASAFAAFGDRAAYTIQVSVPVTRSTRLVAVGEFLPAAGRLTSDQTCGNDTYDGRGEPSPEEIARASACTLPQASQRVALGAGRRFRLGPVVHVFHALTLDASWLRNVVVPLEDDAVGGLGLASLLAVGPNVLTRFGWSVSGTPLEIGIGFRLGLLAADVGDVVQLFLPIEVGFDAGIALDRRGDHLAASR